MQEEVTREICLKEEVDSMPGSMCLVIELSISGTPWVITVLTLTRLIVLSLVYQSLMEPETGKF